MVEPTHLKNMLVKLDHFPKVRGENQKYLNQIAFPHSFSKNRDTPKWMVKIMENPLKMDDLGVPLFSETSIYNYRQIWESNLPPIFSTQSP